MKRPLLLLLVSLLAAPLLRADEPTRALQNELKAQGFYYGEVDGISGPGLTAALKRYQIRNGLEVTGTPTAETLNALNVGGGAAPRAEVEPSPAAPVPSGDAPPEPAKPRVDLRKKQAIVEADQRALKETQEETTTIRRIPRDPSVVSPPADLYRTPSVHINPRYRDVYAGSPFENAPPPLQEQTLRAAQHALRMQGFYGGMVDGIPGPATEDAIAAYQRNTGLPRTGRLDLETLNSMRLLPGPNSVNPVLKPFTAPPRNSRAIRGIWVD